MAIITAATTTTTTTTTTATIVTDVFVFVDMLISFWGQKVKGQGHSKLRYSRQRKPVEFHLASFIIVLCYSELGLKFGFAVQ